MKRILLDTNIILDIALKREPFVQSAFSIFELITQGRISCFINAISVINTHYFIKKEQGAEKAIGFISDLILMVDVVGVDKTTIIDSLQSEFSDFEDAVQEFSAISADIDIIVTRNIKDFKKSKISVFTPDDFLKWFEQ